MALRKEMQAEGVPQKVDDDHAERIARKQASGKDTDQAIREVENEEMDPSHKEQDG